MSWLVHLWRTKGLTDRVSSQLRGLAVHWIPRPPGTRQYIFHFTKLVFLALHTNCFSILQTHLFTILQLKNSHFTALCFTYCPYSFKVKIAWDIFDSSYFWQWDYSKRLVSQRQVVPAFRNCIISTLSLPCYWTSQIQPCPAMLCWQRQGTRLVYFKSLLESYPLKCHWVLRLFKYHLVISISVNMHLLNIKDNHNGAAKTQFSFSHNFVSSHFE